MHAGNDTYEIRAALCRIDDKPGFLQRLKETARGFNTHIICFNADMLAGRRHAESAVIHAVRSFNAGDAISNTLEMEALLYASGSRQCNIAISFGLHVGENRLWVCCYPLQKGVWNALMSIVNFHDDKTWDRIDCVKRKKLMQIFDITPEEFGSLDDQERFSDLVLERVAMLDVLR